MIIPEMQYQPIYEDIAQTRSSTNERTAIRSIGIAFLMNPLSTRILLISSPRNKVGNEVDLKRGNGDGGMGRRNGERGGDETAESAEGAPTSPPARGRRTVGET